MTHHGTGKAVVFFQPRLDLRPGYVLFGSLGVEGRPAVHVDRVVRQHPQCVQAAPRHQVFVLVFHTTLVLLVHTGRYVVLFVGEM